MAGLTISGFETFFDFFKNILYMLYTFLLVAIFFIIQYVFIKFYIYLGKSIIKGSKILKDSLDVSNNGFSKILVGRK